jgi:3'-5' exoribonuclease
MSDNSFDTMEAGAPVSAVFLLKEKSLAQSKVGKKYLTLTLSDRRGDIEGKLWDEAEIVDGQLERMMPVHVEGVVTVYRERPQITVRTIRMLQWTEDLASRLVPTSRFEVGELLTGLDRVLATLSDPHLKALAETIRRDEVLMTRFSAVPAAKMMHHAYLRGLLEHTLSMLQIAAFAADHYGRMFPGLVDRDLLLVGTLLHDVGKIREYRFERGIDITTEGRLVGHLVLGIELLDGLLAKLPDFPTELAQRLKHLIVSHHGDPEKGAPVSPITLEALLLHLVDYMDSQVNGVATLLLQAGEDEYTAWSNKFERRFLTQRGDLEIPPPAGQTETRHATAGTAVPKPPTPPAAAAPQPAPPAAAAPQPTPPAAAAPRPAPPAAAAPQPVPPADATRPPSVREALLMSPPAELEDKLPFEEGGTEPPARREESAEPPGGIIPVLPDREATAPYHDEETAQQVPDRKLPRKPRGPGLPGL